MAKRGPKYKYTEEELWQLRVMVEQKSWDVRAAAREIGSKARNLRGKDLDRWIETVRRAYRTRRDRNDLPPSSPRQEEIVDAVKRKYAGDRAAIENAKRTIEECRAKATELGISLEDLADRDRYHSLREEADELRSKIRGRPEVVAANLFADGLSEDAALEELAQAEEKIAELTAESDLNRKYRSALERLQANPSGQ